MPSSWQLDAQRGLLWRDREVLRLRRRQGAILGYLAERPYRLVTYGELANCGWGRTTRSVGIIRTEIHELRRILGFAAIETVFGLGYRLVAEIGDVSQQHGGPSR